MERIHDQYMVVFGFAFGEGMTAYGPFATTDDALAWAQAPPQHEAWDIVVLHHPEE